MTEWTNRPQEERALLNPAFCATLLWHAASVRKGASRPLAFEECFLVLPLVLPAMTRDALPATTATAMLNWLENNPVEQRRLVVRSRLMVPFTRTALLFGATRGFFRVTRETLEAEEKWGGKVKGFERGSSSEVRACVQKARFVSKWFLKAGSPSTVLAILGVRP
ncbi:hypothetical protein GCM10011487_69720 [Steroidobacter agaridevorans]|uniref:Uncharacterized protein n=1 Tax=Steroidobacter agaridevorans TaxID=2695856 RepID=A0A829YQD1_9GAMM|nr:three component ABC system middle component [Steroidobacter agaridevorans]GFE84972.1 hypothetical protein GCM10011487_69720 [Steroidobacter agaridevorans]